jgi:hypothetical protein
VFVVLGNGEVGAGFVEPVWRLTVAEERGLMFMYLGVAQ